MYLAHAPRHIQDSDIFLKNQNDNSAAAFWNTTDGGRGADADRSADGGKTEHFRLQAATALDRTA